MIKLKTPNSMEIAGQPAVITYVPELNAFRGKFLGLSLTAFRGCISRVSC